MLILFLPEISCKYRALGGCNKVFNPEIILLDIKLGATNGLEVCKNLKASVTTSHIPIVLLTASIVKEHEKKCGQDAFIEKPFDIGFLEATVLGILKRDKSLIK